MKPSRLSTLASLLALPFIALGASIDLSEAPISGATSTEIRPNVLFVMDDSFSMEWDYLPDWAENTAGLYQSRNPGFNGLAYNPEVRYAPPTYFKDGADNTTQYPSQTKAVTNGWTEVKDDGYGVQLVTKRNLVGNAFYYTTTPGEFCAEKRLKSCVGTQSASYPEAAKLRWCTTAADAAAATPGAGACQAIQIGAGIGFTSYMFPRMPAPRTSILKIKEAAAASVSNIKVNDKKILFAATLASSDPGSLATEIAKEINKCSFAVAGDCEIAGYRAEATGDTITISAPGSTTATPVIASSGTLTAEVTAFAKPATNLAPGENLLTVITESTTAYPRASKRDDCASLSTCTYDEEMTNYANWWAYYRTRMQAMKTAASRSFASISDKFRIGYYSINNNTKTDFQNISEFDVAQKEAWYNKLFAATPYRAINQPKAQTPLRFALSQAGRLYAGKLTTLNTVDTIDPVQFYCQPNVTILSTDGYWNQAAGVDIKGNPAIGDRDGPGLEVRPMLDDGPGQKWQSTLQEIVTRTPTQDTWVQKKTQQLQSKTGQRQKRTFTQSQFSTSQLQSRTSQWQTQEYKLQARHHTNNLSSTITGYLQRTKGLQTRTGTLQSQTAQLQTRTKTQAQMSKSQLQFRTGQRQKKTYPLQQRLTQVQQRTSTNSGVSWSGWSDADSCTPVASGFNRVQCQTLATGAWTDVSTCSVKAGNTVVNNVGGDDETTTYNTKSECQYSAPTAWTNDPLCKNGVQKSTTSPYSVAFECQTEWATSWTIAIEKCDVSDTMQCQYTAWSPYENVDTCSGVTQSSGTSFTVLNAVQCKVNQWTPWKDTDTTCTKTSTVECQYGAWSTAKTDATCTPIAKSTGPTSFTVIQARQCPVAYSAWSYNVPSCEAVSTGGEQRQCQYATNWSSWSSATSCTAVDVSAGPSYVGPARECQPVWGTPTTTATCTPSATVTCSTGWTAWTDVPYPGGCTATSTNGTGPFGSTECRYRISTPWFNSAGCTPIAQSDGPNYTVNTAQACQAVWSNGWFNVDSGSCTPSKDNTECQYTDWTGWTDGECPNPPNGLAQSTAAPYTTLTATQCQTTWTQWANVDSCKEDDKTQCNTEWPGTWSNASSCDQNNPLQQCQTITTSDWAPPLPASADSEPVLTSGVECNEGTDGNGVTTSCQKLKPNPSLPFAAATCVEGTDANGVITACSEVKTGPVAVDECTEVAAKDGPNFVATLCKTLPTGATPDTLADVAEYYWKTDLRDEIYSNCTGGPVKSGDVTTHYDVCFDSEKEKQPRQLMETYTLGLGASGVMQYQKDYETATSGDFYSVKMGLMAEDGACPWQKYGECNWPKPVSNEQTNIDDLWHAAVNGRGRYFSAENPSDVSSALSEALKNITVKNGALAAVSVTSRNLTGGPVGLFRVSFTAGTWTGEVQKFTAEMNTSGALTVSGEIWAAAGLLDKKTYTSRAIQTFDASASDKLTPFDWGHLTDDQKAYFRKPNIDGLSQLCTTGTICLAATAKDAADEENLVNFLRGDRSNEGPGSATEKYFRQRTHVLGDIVGSEAVYVQKAPWSYTDSGYSAFKTGTASRTGMVYVGANDGMLHALNATTGEEAWAYVPAFLMPGLYRLADKTYGNLHHFFVDGTPVMGDICTANCGPDSTTAQWKTILVGGANRGGRGYYALDITDPANPKGLWEFTDTNLGYSYGNPVITKLTDGTWVVMFASGYNNLSPGDGKGRLFILNADSGALIGDGSIATAAGDTTTPSGLAKIAAWANYPDFNNTAQRVYGGDLQGNLWRFDINDIIAPAGKEATLLATLKDANGNAQPISSRPELALIKNKPVVFVATGQLLGTSDLDTDGKQSTYAIKDNLDTDSYGDPRASTNSFVGQTMTSATCDKDKPPCKVTSSKEAVDWATKDGWYVDFPVAGERVNTDMELAAGTLVITTNTPQSGACVPAGVSYLYTLDYLTGGYVEGTDGVVGIQLSNTLGSSPTLIQAYGHNLGLVQGDCSTAECMSASPIPTSLPGLNMRRISWRELVVE